MACVVRGIAVIVVGRRGVAVSTTTNDGADGSCERCSEVRIGGDGGGGSAQCVMR